MSDLISRQDVLDEIRRFSGYLDDDMMTRIYIGLNRLPSTQAEILTCDKCKYADEKPISDGRHFCSRHGSFMYYCSDAERREK